MLLSRSRPPRTCDAGRDRVQLLAAQLALGDQLSADPLRHEAHRGTDPASAVEQLAPGPWVAVASIGIRLVDSTPPATGVVLTGGDPRRREVRRLL